MSRRRPGNQQFHRNRQMFCADELNIFFGKSNSRRQQQEAPEGSRGQQEAAWGIDDRESDLAGSLFNNFSKKQNSGKQLIISTGKWGCGMFGGNPVHKFLQQVIAMELARLQLGRETTIRMLFSCCKEIGGKIRIIFIAVCVPQYFGHFGFL